MVRGADEQIPNGDSVIFASNYLIVLADEFRAAHTKKLLSKLADRSKPDKEEN